MADRTAPDKMPLREFVESVAGQLLIALESVEARHPSWEVGALTVVAKGALKPVTQGGATAVWIDVDEPAHTAISEIPIPLRRRAR